MGGNEHLTVGEFTRLMDIHEKRNADRFRSLDGRLSVISHDVREIRIAGADHQTRLTVIETKGQRATKVSWSAVVAAVLLGLAEAARQFFKA